MKLLMVLSVYILSCSLWAEDQTSINQQANRQKAREINEKSLVCFNTKANSDVTLIKSAGFEQKFKIKEKAITVNFKYQKKQLFNESNSEILLARIKGQKVTKFKVNDFGFRKSNFNLGELHKNLETIDCYLTRKAFLIEQEHTNSFIIHNHVQERYYGKGDSFTSWYSSYAKGFENATHYIFLDGPSIGSGYVLKEKQIKANAEEYRNADLLMEELENSNYKVAPSGNIHLSLNSKFTGDITIMGIAYNYCVQNVIYSIARAVISAGISSMTLKFPGYYNHVQKNGLTKELNIEFESKFNDLTTFKLKASDEFQSYFKKQKSYIEEGLNSQIEVLLKGQKAKTKLPQLIIDVF